MPSPTENRRYSAILAIDVVGYSGLVEKDEIGTVRAVRRLRTEVISPVLKTNGGRLVKTMGDGFLAEFAAPDAALSAAMDIQTRTVEAAADQPESQRLILRVGAHLAMSSSMEKTFSEMASTLRHASNRWQNPVASHPQTHLPAHCRPNLGRA